MATVSLCRVALCSAGLLCTTTAFYASLPASVAAAKDGGGHGGDHDGGGRDGGGDDGGHGGGDDSDNGRDRTVGRFLDSLRSRGRVVWSSNSDGAIEVRYADGWSERVSGRTYLLIDPSRRRVVSRAAKASDFDRLRAAID